MITGSSPGVAWNRQRSVPGGWFGGAGAVAFARTVPHPAAPVTAATVIPPNPDSTCRLFISRIEKLSAIP